MSALRSTSRVTGLNARVRPYYSSTTVLGSSERDSGLQLAPRGTKRVKLDDTSADIEDVPEESTLSNRKSSSSSLNQKRGNASSPRKAKPIQKSLKVPHPSPSQWRETYDTIKEMRSRIVAPVDTMGCDQAQLKEEDPKNQRFATLVSLMLSSQTKDEVTDAAVSRLRNAIGGSLTVNAIIEAEEITISDAIAKVGFWRRKTQYLKQTAERLRDEFSSDVPGTVDELCSLPGVGPKMAFLALQVAWKLNAGIGVDVHVHRITNRLGWHRPPTKNPEETRLNLESWLPTELHPEINHLLVGFGQTICLPVRPRCDLCDLSSRSLCPSAQIPKGVKTKSRKRSGPKIEIILDTVSDPASSAINSAPESPLVDGVAE